MFKLQTDFLFKRIEENAKGMPIMWIPYAAHGLRAD